MSKPATLVERSVLRTLWLCGQVGLGPLVTRGYLWMMATLGPKGMPLAFRGYTPSAADVLVCTYSKSGTNWMMQIVAQIADRGAAEFDDIHDIVPWPEAPVPSQVAALDTPIRSATGLRAVKTHVPAEHVPVVEAARYVVVVRDPKDVFVSSFHFANGILGGVGLTPRTLDDWHARYVQRRFPLGSWAEHTAGWWALRERPNVLVLTFAELVEDLPSCVDRVADFMGVELTPAEAEAVVARSEFSWMKAHQDKFTTPVPSVGKPRAIMIRTGKKGSARQELSEAQRAAIDTACREELEAMGSDFPYNRLFATS